MPDIIYRELAEGEEGEGLSKASEPGYPGIGAYEDLDDLLAYFMVACKRMSEHAKQERAIKADGEAETLQ